jgi:Mg-chelatase subunit ChlD
MLKRARTEFATRYLPTHRRSGNALVMATLVILIMFGMLAFSTDIGYLTMTKSDTYTAVDAGSLAAAMALPDGRTAATAAMNQYLGLNGVSTGSTSNDITLEFGRWDSTNATFTVTNDDSQMDAVRVTAMRNQVDSFFGRVLNKNSYKVRASSIAIKSAPLDIMMVLDLSGSMSNYGRIQALQFAAPKFVHAIEAVGDDHQIGVMGFSAPVTYNPASRGHTGTLYTAPGLVQVAGSELGVLEANLTTDFDYLRGTVLTSSRLTAGKYGGATGTGGGIRDATHYLKNSTYGRQRATKVIVLMSDGHANRPLNTADEYAYAQADTAKAANVPVYTIALGTGADKTLLRNIAARANGSFFDAPGNSSEQLKRTLQEAFEAVAAAASRPVIVH